jgi:UDP-glucose:(heptosyl)LPS alpha-1,3-glucosyltransferase
MCIAEQMERLAGEFEFHLYSSRVADLDLSSIIWHRVWVPPGPHLLRFLWWMFANRFCRGWHRLRGLRHDLVYSPGINCLDADLIAVHMLFETLRLQMRKELSFRENSALAWPVLVHRKIYYKLIGFLESRIYSDENVTLITVSEKSAREIKALYGRRDDLAVIYDGLDTARFGPGRRLALRAKSRDALSIGDDEIAVLLIGNDLKKKGLTCLLESAAKMNVPKIGLMIVGEDSAAPYQDLIRKLGLVDQVKFLPQRQDVEFYYAAADVYAGPSLEDTFSMPPAEAMACGLPVITSRAAGVSELIHNGVDGFVLEDPRDSETLSILLAKLRDHPEFRAEVGKAAAQSVAQFTWEQNAEQLKSAFQPLLEMKSRKH